MFGVYVCVCVNISKGITILERETTNEKKNTIRRTSATNDED